jgi:archaemetzincin
LDKQQIILLSCEHFEKDVLNIIADDIKREFQALVSIKESSIDLSNYYNPARRQYDDNQILKAVELLHPAAHYKILGLFRVDLYIPILTYIFGQAKLGGNTGIASLYRLKNELYGLDKNPNLLINRFRKVVIHEMGHMFGLVHCPNPICIMRSSTYVEDIDQKENHFCPACSSILLEMEGV